MVGCMLRLIDDEAETSHLVLRGWHQKASFLEVGIPLAATGGDDFRYAGMMIRTERGDHHPVIGMFRFKGATVLYMGLTGCQHSCEDCLPGIGLPILIVASAQRRSNPVNRSGNVIATVAQAQSSS